MENLSVGERNLVSLGAALASNSVGCVEHYVSEARKAGYTDRQIEEAVHAADRARRAPIQNVFDAAIGLLSGGAAPESGTTPDPEKRQTEQPRGAAAEPKTPPRRGCC